MKFKSYQEYIEAATEYFSGKTNLKVPVEYMLLSEEMYNLFNGDIKFGAGEDKSTEKTGNGGCCGKCEGGRCNPENTVPIKETKP